VKSELYHKDARLLREDLAPNSIDGVVTDPPYGMGFIGLDWDKALPPKEVWAACYEVLKPGAYCLAFAHTRLDHHLKCDLEDAGFLIKDTLCWIYSSGFPNSPDMEKEMLKKGAPPEIAKQWKGWSKRLKTAWEPIVLAQKPTEGTYVENCLKYGLGPINIDGNRIPYASAADKESLASFEGFAGTDHGDIRYFSANEGGKKQVNIHPDGRWPANVMWFDKLDNDYDRYFIVPKPSPEERRKYDPQIQNEHSTVKPLNLMDRLISLFTPSPIVVGREVVVLDPFVGSGTTALACVRQNRIYMAYENWDVAYRIAKKRLRDNLYKDNQVDLCA
jgi:site-specific DNA-methyltransferase (adenine-specific)